MSEKLKEVSDGALTRAIIIAEHKLAQSIAAVVGGRIQEDIRLYRELLEIESLRNNRGYDSINLAAHIRHQIELERTKELELND